MTDVEANPPVIHANVAYDPLIWVEIPVMWGPESWPSPDAWAEQLAEELWADLDHTAVDVANLERLLAFWGEKLGGINPELDIEVITYLHLPHPAVEPLPVRVMIDNEGSTAAQLAEVQDPAAIEPPVVDEFRSDHLGTGIRVLRYRPLGPTDDASSGAVELYAVLRYAFEIPNPEAVLVVTSSCADLGRLIQAMDDMDTFVRAIRWDYEPRDLEPA